MYVYYVYIDIATRLKWILPVQMMSRQVSR